MILKTLISTILIACALALSSGRAYAEFSPPTDFPILERYQIAQQTLQNQLVSYKNARDNWKDYRTKHKDLTDPTQALIAVEEARSYSSRSFTAYKGYLAFVRARFETITSVDEDSRAAMLVELDTATVWLDTKLNELTSSTWTLDSLRALSVEFTSFRDRTKVRIWSMVDSLLLSRIDQYLTEFDGLLPLLDQALEAQDTELTVTQASSLRSSIAAVRAYEDEVRTAHAEVKALIVPEADMATLQAAYSQITSLNEQVAALKKMVLRLVAVQTEPALVPIEEIIEDTIE